MKKAPAKRSPTTKPTREEAAQIALKWSIELESTLLALLNMLDRAKREISDASSPLAEFFRASDIESVRQSVANGWCECASVRPQNPIGLRFPSPAEMLRERNDS